MHNYDITTESEFMSLDRLDERNRNKALVIIRFLIQYEV